MRWLPIVLLLLPLGLQAQTLSGTVVAITEGDRLTILDARKRQHRVKLAEIDAPDTKQPFGRQSRQSLSSLCFKKAARVEWQANEGNKRHIGHVSCAGIDASAEQVRRGMAWASPRFTKPGSPLYELEAYARIRGVGLWADPRPIPPWERRAPVR
jgi:endonuclease YncB( thermonuclease family)